MLSLITKLQYKNFETGEFTEERERSYDETIVLIESFPWEKQREKIEIGLTNPSITIANSNNEFLKLALFYNNKFVLHFFDAQQQLYTKSLTSYKDAYPFIQTFFSFGTLNPTDFKHENTWLRHNLKHFVSQDFRYEVTPHAAWRFLLRTSSLSLAFGVFTLSAMFMIISDIPLWALTFFLAVAFFLGGGLNLILFFNYRRFAIGKVLIMSKGNDTFWLGAIDSPVAYSKKDIQLATIYETKSGKNPIYGFAMAKILFKDGSVVHIPSIFLDMLSISRKLDSCPRASSTSFPFIKNAGTVT